MIAARQYTIRMQEHKNEPAAAKEDWERAFDGLVFPAAKPYILRKAHDHGGLDTEVLDILNRVPDDEYHELEALIAAIREIYSQEDMKSPI